MICLVCVILKWWNGSGKLKWPRNKMVNYRTLWTQPQEHSQPNRISFLILSLNILQTENVPLREFLTLNPYRCVGARVWWHRTWLRSSPDSILPVPSILFESLWVRLSSSGLHFIVSEAMNKNIYMLRFKRLLLRSILHCDVLPAKQHYA